MAFPPQTGVTGPIEDSSSSPPEAPDKSCFICLQTPADEPDAVWVTPCPCSLDAHEQCLLRWIAETEAKNGGALARLDRKNRRVRCPQCNARIRTDEARDWVVDVAGAVLGHYRALAPTALVALLAFTGMAGSAAYGLCSMALFMGPTRAWLWVLAPALESYELLRLPMTGIFGVFKKYVEIPLSQTLRIFLLNLIGPTLVLHRALPGLVSTLTLTPALVYNWYCLQTELLTLVRLTWLVRSGSVDPRLLAGRRPLRRLFRSPMQTLFGTPTLALSMMPVINIVYNRTYYSLFGALEKRLDDALRGRMLETPEADEQPVDGEAGEGGAAAVQNGVIGAEAAVDAPVQPPEPQGEQVPQDPGVFGLLGVPNIFRHLRITMGLLGLAEDHINLARDDAALADEIAQDNVIDLQVEIAVQRGFDEPDGLPVQRLQGNMQGFDHGNDNNNNDGDDDDEWVDEVDEDEILPPRQRRRRRQRDNDDHGEVLVPFQGPIAAEDLALPPDPPAAAAAEPAPPVPAQLPDAFDGRFSFGGLMASALSQLLLPGVASLAGTVLQLVLPRSWVVAPRALYPTDMRGRPLMVRTSLLQTRWGRSFVGGMLFIVLRDLCMLYVKYRRVEQRKHRHIRNVDRHRGEGRTVSGEKARETDAAV